MANSHHAATQFLHSSKYTPYNDSGKTVLISEKRVRFSERLNVIDIVHRNDLMQNEISNTWYNRSEIMKIKLRLDQDVQLINKGGKLDDFTSRGLEDRFSSARRARRASNKLNAVISVLNEQDRQVLQGKINPKSIRQAYLRFSRNSQSEAFKVAKADEREVQNLCRGQIALSGAQSVFQKHDTIRMKKEVLLTRLFTLRRLSHTEMNK
jgi:hypothetical protein